MFSLEYCASSSESDVSAYHLEYKLDTASLLWSYNTVCLPNRRKYVALKLSASVTVSTS